MFIVIKKRQKNRFLLFLAVFLFNLSLFSQEAPEFSEEPGIDAPEITRLLDTLSSHRLYREILNDKDFTYSILSGIVDGLNDPHSGVFKQYQYQWQFSTSSIEQSDSGIIPGTNEYGQLTAAAVLSGSPAEYSKVLQGDIILRIGNVNTAGVPIWELLPLLSGREGAGIPLALQTPGKEPREITVILRPFEVQSISLQTGRLSRGNWRQEKEGSIAWIKIHTFLGEQTLEEWDRAVEQIQSNPSVKRLIIDLRDNGGGDNSSIRLLGDFFRYSDVLVRFESLLGEEGRREVITNTDLPRSRLMTYPAAVLINSNTASLAEISAMALRDNRSLKIFGENSYGKGTTQTWLNLNEDFSIHLTLGNWFSPNGSSVEGRGIVPDYTVADNPRTKKDEQLIRCLEVLSAELY